MRYGGVVVTPPASFNPRFWLYPDGAGKAGKQATEKLEASTVVVHRGTAR